MQAINLEDCPRKKNIGAPYQECPRGTSFFRCTCRSCRCGRCAICGFQKHMAIHGPKEEGSSEPWDHEFVPES